MDEPTSALTWWPTLADDADQGAPGGARLRVVFVTHDMSLVSHFSQRLMVMYAGQVAEWAPPERLDTPRHPYSIGLMEAFPRSGASGPAHRHTRPAAGPVPAPAGLLVRTGLPKVMTVCTETNPDLYRSRTRCAVPALRRRGGRSRADGRPPVTDTTDTRCSGPTG